MKHGGGWKPTSIAIFGVHQFYITIKLSNENTKKIVNTKYKITYESTATVRPYRLNITSSLLKSLRLATMDFTTIESSKIDFEK